MTCPRGHGHADCILSCAVCGTEDCGGIGRWACHADTDVTPVCTGACWRIYQAAKEDAKVLDLWTHAIGLWSHAIERWGDR